MREAERTCSCLALIKREKDTAHIRLISGICEGAALNEFQRSNASSKD